MWQTPKERQDELFRRLTILFFLIFILLGIGTVVYHLTEGWSYLESLYFSTISLTTRGYSDVRPTHVSSILFSVFYLIIGVAVLIYGLSTMLAFYTSFYQPRIESRLHHIVDRITHKSDKYVMIKSEARKAFDPNQIRRSAPKPVPKTKL